MSTDEGMLSPCRRIPVHVWFDGPNQLTRMDVYGGLDSTYVLPVHA